MEIIVFKATNKPQQVDEVEDDSEFPLIWFDFNRQHTARFQQVRDLLKNFEVDEKHILDSLNELHPSFFDGMQNYDMVIFRGLCQDTTVNKLETQPTAFFLFERCLVTVHSETNQAIATVKQRILSNNYKSRHLPLHAAALMHQILDVMVNQLLATRQPFSEELDTLRKALLNNDFSQWQAFINQKHQLLKLEMLCEQQVDALMAWREETRGILDEHSVVRYNDLIEHLHRVSNHVKNLQSEIEFLIQLQFSAQAQRTNQIILPLTLASIIFLPLNLIASIFGMNFVDLPLIQHPLGYLYAFTGMAMLTVGLLLIFKYKRWM